MSAVRKACGNSALSVQSLPWCRLLAPRSRQKSVRGPDSASFRCCFLRCLVAMGSSAQKWSRQSRFSGSGLSSWPIQWRRGKWTAPVRACGGPAWRVSARGGWHVFTNTSWCASVFPAWEVMTPGSPAFRFPALRCVPSRIYHRHVNAAKRETRRGRVGSPCLTGGLKPDFLCVGFPGFFIHHVEVNVFHGVPFVLIS